MDAAIGTPTGALHRLQLLFGSNYLYKAYATTLDLAYNKPVCYLDNNIIQRCGIDATNKLIYMDFDFSIPVGEPIHVKFSVLDSRNPEVDGFRYIGGTDVSTVEVDLIANGATYVFQTRPFPAKETQVGGTGNPLPQRGIHNGTADWATNLINKLNVIDITLFVNRSDITGLQF